MAGKVFSRVGWGRVNTAGGLLLRIDMTLRIHCALRFLPATTTDDARDQNYKTAFHAHDKRMEMKATR